MDIASGNDCHSVLLKMAIEIVSFPHVFFHTYSTFTKGYEVDFIPFSLPQTMVFDGSTNDHHHMAT